MKTITVCSLVLMLSSPVFALSFIGPATPEMSKGQINIGTEGFVGECELTFDVLGYEISGTIKPSGFGFRPGYCIADDWEIFGRLGLARIDDPGRDYTESAFVSYLESLDLAWGLGTRTTLIRKDGFAFGILAQADWSYQEEYDLEVELNTLLITTSLTFRKDWFALYGGPFLRVLSGDADFMYMGSSIPIGIERDGEIGAYVGLMLGEKPDRFCVEFQHANDSSFVALSVTHLF